MESLKIPASKVPSTIQKPVETQSKPESQNTSRSNSNNGKIIMSALASAGVIAAAVMIIRNRKSMTTLTVDKFKEAGNKFIKGKAVNKKGKPFTGVINNITESGHKSSMTFVNGMLQEVKTSQKAINGEYLQSGTKKYTYKPSGKINEITVTHNSNVSGTTPETSGLKNITETINLDKKRREGLYDYSNKLAQEIKQNNIKETVEQTRQKLAHKPTINATTVDEYFENLYNNNETSETYNRLKQGYRKIEAKETALKEKVARLKEHLHKKPEINAQTIDGQFANEPALQNLNDFYREIEAKDTALKENVSKLKKHLHKKTEINAQKIDEQFAQDKTELSKLKDSLLNPKAVDAKAEAELAEKINNDVMNIRKNVIDEYYTFDHAQQIKAHIDKYVKTFPEGTFVPVNKTIQLSNGKGGSETINIVYEGHTLDITSDGNLLQKLLVPVNDLSRVEYKNLTRVEEQARKVIADQRARVSTQEKAHTYTKQKEQVKQKLFA